MKKSHFTKEQIAHVLRQAAGGMAVTEIIPNATEHVILSVEIRQVPSLNSDLGAVGASAQS